MATTPANPLPKHTTIRLPQELHEQIRENAEREYRTVAAEVRRLIERGLAVDEQERAAA